MFQQIFEEIVSNICRGCAAAMPVVNSQASNFSSATFLMISWYRVKSAINIVFVVVPPATGVGPTSFDLAIIPVAAQDRLLVQRRNPGLVIFIMCFITAFYLCAVPDSRPNFFSNFSCFLSRPSVLSRLPKNDLNAASISFNISD